jgi:uncharacterized membrane protein
MDAYPDRRYRTVNMHPLDRAASGVIGGALLLWAVRRGSLPGALLALAGVGMLYRGVTGNCPGYTALGFSTTSAEPPDAPGAREDAPTVERWITVAASREMVYRALQRPDTLARMMGHFADLHIDGDCMHWGIALPWGRRLEWQARLFEHRPGEQLSWMSEPGAAVRSEGAISLDDAPGDRGTVVTLQVAFTPPGGSLGGAAMKLLRVVPEAVAQRALQRLKSLVETGEIATSEHDPSGRRPAERRLAAPPRLRLAGGGA